MHRRRYFCIFYRYCFPGQKINRCAFLLHKHTPRCNWKVHIIFYKVQRSAGAATGAVMVAPESTARFQFTASAFRLNFYCIGWWFQSSDRGSVGGALIYVNVRRADRFGNSVFCVKRAESTYSWFLLFALIWVFVSSWCLNAVFWMLLISATFVVTLMQRRGVGPHYFLFYYPADSWP